MNTQFIHSEFNSKDTLELVTQMVHTKIKYHENKINNQTNEEDIKTREEKIKRLQKELFELRQMINSKTNNVKVKALIKIA